MSKPIDGPINIGIVKGNVNGCKKKIVLFMDMHLNVSFQNNCRKFESTDIVTFFKTLLKDMMKNKKTRYDILLEDTHFYFKKSRAIRYIDRVYEMLSVVFNKETSAKDTMKSLLIDNAILHTLEIRNFLVTHDIAPLLTPVFNILYGVVRSGIIYPEMVKEIIERMNEVGYIVNQTKEFFEQALKEKKKNIILDFLEKEKIESVKEHEKCTKLIISKIVNDYEKESTRKKIHEIINNHIIHYLNTFLDLVDEMLSYSTEVETIISRDFPLKRKINSDGVFSYYEAVNHDSHISIATELLKKIIKIDKTMVIINSTILDIYFLRRIVDNEKITNVFMYTGVHHSINLIYLLVKYFSFDLDSLSKSTTSVKNISSIIKKNNSPVNIFPLILVDDIKQCSDIKNLSEMI